MNETTWWIIPDDIIYPVIFSKLIKKVDFGWPIRVIAFIMLFLSISVLGLRMRSKPPDVRRIFDAQAWKEPAFTIYAIALFVEYLGLYIRTSTSRNTVLKKTSLPDS
jgi:hypothetical protein